MLLCMVGLPGTMVDLPVTCNERAASLNASWESHCNWSLKIESRA